MAGVQLVEKILNRRSQCAVGTAVHPLGFAR
jgi:hypothetical protein